MNCNPADSNIVFKTVQKTIKAPKASELSTPHPSYTMNQSHPLYHKKIRIKPTTMKALSNQVKNLLEGQKANDEQIIYQLLGRIHSIEPVNNTYRLDFSDDTYAQRDLQIVVKSRILSNLNNYLAKGSQDILKINEIQFEPTPQQGQPYFRLFLKIAIEENEEKKRAKLIIQRYQKISDFEIISYHYLRIMEAAFRMSDKS